MELAGFPICKEAYWTVNGTAASGLQGKVTDCYLPFTFESMNSSRLV